MFQNWKKRRCYSCFYLLLVFLPKLTSSSETTGEEAGDILLEDLLEYPIIVNYEIDKAVFIVPDKGCHVITDGQTTKSILFHRRFNVYTENGETVNDIIGLCEQYQNASIDGVQFLLGVRNRAFLIYPGTKWCGVGNATYGNSSELGEYRQTDACCRDHDTCQDYVIGFTCHESIDGLCNRSPFTRSNCDCDEQFRQCLLSANETASHRIGVLFFTVLGLKCFREDYPIIRCEEYGGFLNIHCQKYMLDYEKGKMYQFFDSPKYISNVAGNDSTSMSSSNGTNEEKGQNKKFVRNTNFLDIGSSL